MREILPPCGVTEMVCREPVVFSDRVGFKTGPENFALELSFENLSSQLPRCLLNGLFPVTSDALPGRFDVTVNIHVVAVARADQRLRNGTSARPVGIGRSAANPLAISVRHENFAGSAPRAKHFDKGPFGLPVRYRGEEYLS